MICASCGSANDPGRKFCGDCGSPLAVTCAACGSPNSPTVRFCGECGGVLLASARPASAEAPPAEDAVAVAVQPIAERRHVSVLFADLVGFTTLSESRDAEEVRELLGRYFDTCRALVARYGGVIEKFIGDAVMAVWGAPQANEDDAERAVRAGLDLAAGVAALGEEVGLPELRARVGILSGEAAVTLGATGQGMVAGDLVNTASRIQSAAKPGQVLVGGDTKLASDQAVEYQDAGSHQLKGKAEPMQLWRAVRVVGLTGGVARGQQIEPPFTGRDPELRLIKQLFHASADERRAHLVSVLGVAGVGKSRLAWELEKYVDGLAQEVWWLHGRCLAYGDGVAFWALGEMVRSRAGIVEDEEAETALPKLRAALEDLLTDDERRFVEPRLAQLLGLEVRGPGDQENLFSAWRMFLERLADRGPMVMVFEDVHWADAALLDFIEYLLDWARDKPIFIMTLARPELLETRTTWGAGRRSLTSILLEPLPADQIATLLEGSVTGLPEDLRHQILERSEGIPFYAVETVRMLLDRGLLVRDDGAYRPTGPITTLEVPPTLHALIAARLDGLQPEERRILQDASVLGRTFSLVGLTAVSGLDEAALRPLVDSLTRKEILAPTTDPMSPERGQYGFLQDLVKRVAYDTMSKRDRRPRHLAAARHLTALSGEDDVEVVEVIAAHLVDAYQAVPDAEDADEVRRQARDALFRAAERAASLGATVAAQRQFERAAELSDDPMECGELLERAGQAAVSGGRHRDAEALLERAQQRFEAQDASHPAARVRARVAEIHWDTGRFAQELERMDEAFLVLAQDEPDADLAALAAQIGRFAFFAGKDDLAAERLEWALKMSEALGLPETLSQALNTKALLLNAGQRRREALAILRYALDVAIEHDKPSAALRAYNNLSDLSNADDRYADGERYASEGLQLARRVGNRYWEQILMGQRIGGLYALGQWSEALEQMAELDASVGESPVRTAFTQGYVGFGAAMHVARGEPDAARELLDAFADLGGSADIQEQVEHALGVASSLLGHDPGGAMQAALQAWALRQQLGWDDPRVKECFTIAVEAALAAGQANQAEELLTTMRGRQPGISTHHGLAESMRLGARLALLRDPQADVEDAWKGAIGLFREMETPFWTARCMIDQAAWLLDRGRDDEAANTLADARGIFEGLGATAWIERVDAMVPGRPGLSRAQVSARVEELRSEESD